jgi:hypothetical protein
MKEWFRAGMVTAIGLLLGSSPVWGQVVRERDTTVTGPRGRTIQRDLKSVKGPGFIDRQTTITRPGGTFTSNALIQRRPPMMGGPVWGGPRPWFGPGRGPVFVENVVTPGPGPLGGALPFLGGLGLGLGVGGLAGAAIASQPAQPVVVAPTPPPTVVVAQPQPYSPAPPPPPTVVVDPVAQEITRLTSHHAQSRRDAAAVLGRLRDPRAIPALVERLKYDTDKDVRIVSATALGEIGDPNAGIYLERVTIYDKKQEVRDAAAIALSRLPRPVPAGTVPPSAYPQPTNLTPATPPSSVPSVTPLESVPPPPMPDPPTSSVPR